uniref:Uncharacterized protein n=1 Tax=Rhizophora mucronata TaxID=61149 RepID=A0A2P2P622_RHIMU
MGSSATLFSHSLTSLHCSSLTRWCFQRDHCFKFCNKTLKERCKVNRRRIFEPVLNV